MSPYILIALPVAMIIIGLIQICSSASGGDGNSSTVHGGPDLYLDGKLVTNDDDRIRYWVVVGYTEGILDRAYEIKDLLKHGETEDGEDLLREWCERKKQIEIVNARLDRHRYTINDTEAQMEAAYESWKEKRAQYVAHCEEIAVVKRIITTALKDSGSVTMKRHLLKQVISEKMGIEKGDANKMYRELIKQNYLAEVSGEGKHVYVGKTGKRPPTNKYKHRRTEPKPQKPAVYDPSMYSRVDKTLYYKSKITVGDPISLDKENGTAFFISKSRGEKYATSLSKCSCPMGSCPPCKHMLTLAIELGYWDQSALKHK